MGVFLSLLGTTVQADPQRGEKLYKKNLCSACHSLGGKGGKVGPALDGVASRQNKAWLTQQIKDSKVNNPKSLMRKFSLSEEDVKDIVDYLLTLK